MRTLLKELVKTSRNYVKMNRRDASLERNLEYRFPYYYCS